jgi:hypothetical protein
MVEPSVGRKLAREGLPEQVKEIVVVFRDVGLDVLVFCHTGRGRG